MKKINTILLFCCLLAASLYGQISFSNQTDLLELSLTFQSGISVGIADMNGDGLDDIVRIKEPQNQNEPPQLHIEYQSGNGQAFIHKLVGNIVGNDTWSLSIGDVNNDGFCDVLTGGYYDGVKVLSAVNGGEDFMSASLPGANIFIQGSNFADINNDGWLDVFACHDDGESRIWGNDGSGAFVAADDWIDMATVPVSDNSGNYGSVWTDFDNDRDNDLYIAKCRQGVDNPADPRRINALFQNDGLSNYQEVAGKYGLKIGWQSWTADFQDIDNDGDMDCLITNHDYNLQLLENDGAGHFTDISASAIGSHLGGFLQGIMRDFDNDGFMDILTAEPTNLLHNNGDKTFSVVDNAFGGNNLGTFALGDLNHDGFQDLYAAYACGINTPCGTADKMWLNDGNDNHFLGVSLSGVSSNKMGVGTRLEIHGSWGIQIREVRSGESYGINNSLTQHFGLGDETIIEYLVVRWPSGTVDVVKNPGADQFLNIVEGSTCALPAVELVASGDNVLCPGETVQLSAPAGYTYLWNDGSVSQSIEADGAGNFSVLLVDELGCVAASNVFAISVNPDETPVLSVAGELKFCQGESVTLTSSEAAAYTWSNGETTQSIVVEEAGDYLVTVPGACNEFSSAAVQVEVLAAPAPITEPLVLYPTGLPVELVAIGSNPHWYDSPVSTDPIAVNDTLIAPSMDAAGQVATYYVEDWVPYGGGLFASGMIQHLGSQFNGNSFNGQEIFDVLEPLTLKTVKVYTDEAGLRTIELRDADDAVLQSATVDIPVGTTDIALNFYILPGTGYRLTTNEAQNQATLGTNSPRLRRSDQGVAYPYEAGDALAITGSNYGAGFYYYFYNWQIEVTPLECISERLTVTVAAFVNTHSNAAPFGKMAALPNPSNGTFALDLEAVESGETYLRITDLTGRTLLEQQFYLNAGVSQRQELDLQGTASGVYFLQVRSGERMGWMKLVVE